MTQQHLPDHIRSIFEETFRPNLVGFLRENLVPLNASLLEGQNNAQSAFHDATVSRLSTQFDNLSIEVQNIRAQLGQPISTRKQVQSKEFLKEMYIYISTTFVKSIAKRSRYYLVFLYLGHFLRNIL